jgi:hypothetical protein
MRNEFGNNFAYLGLFLQVLLSSQDWLGQMPQQLTFIQPLNKYTFILIID